MIDGAQNRSYFSENHDLFKNIYFFNDFAKFYDFYRCLTGLKWPLNGHFKQFRTIRSIRNEFVASISSSLSPPRPFLKASRTPKVS